MHQSSSDGAKVFIAVPYYQTFPGECINNSDECCTDPNFAMTWKHGEAFVERNFSACWVEALNSRDEAHWTQFCMIHVDVQPHARRWLDLLLLELKRSGADLLSVVLPIKTQHGITSTAIMDPDDRWKRITMRELDAIPDLTFDAAGAGYPGCRLLASTGLWICDFTKPWVEDVWFETRCRIVKRGGDACVCGHSRTTHAEDGPCFQGCTCQKFCPTGKTSFSAEHFPEDWHFSKLLHAQGLKVMATKLLACSHWGMAPYLNDRPWGTIKKDDWHPRCDWIDSFIPSAAGTAATTSTTAKEELQCLP